MKRLFALLCVLAASAASAQVGTAPGFVLKDEGTTVARVRSMNVVGSSVTCTASAGAGTCTFTAPTVTLTAGVTSTSGCTDGGFLYSLSSLVRCGSLMFASGTNVAIGSTLSLAPAGNNLILGNASGNAGIAFGQTWNANGSIGWIYNATPANGYTYLATYAYGNRIEIDGSSLKLQGNASAGGVTIGSSALGTSVVPLTVTPGTGSTANLLNLTNSAGTSLSYFDSSGDLFLPTASGYIKPKGYTSSYIRLSDSAGTYLVYGSNSVAIGGSNLVISQGGDKTLSFNSAGMTYRKGMDYNIQTTSATRSFVLAKSDGNTFHQSSAGVALTEAGGAETVLLLTSATTNTFDVVVDYRVTATDGTDRATRGGTVRFVCDNAATVVTCSAPSATDQTNDGRNGGGSQFISTNSKTLTYAIAIDTATANVAKLTFNIDSDMTVSAASITMTVTINGTVTPS